MAQTVNSSPEQIRLSVDLEPSLHRLLRVAAAEHDQTVAQYVLEAIKERLVLDSNVDQGTTDLRAATDPVLADLWDNAKDGEYDRL